MWYTFQQQEDLEKNIKMEKKKPSQNKAAIEIYQVAPLIKTISLNYIHFYYFFQGSPGWIICLFLAEQVPSLKVVFG